MNTHSTIQHVSFRKKIGSHFNFLLHLLLLLFFCFHFLSESFVIFNHSVNHTIEWCSYYKHTISSVCMLKKISLQWIIQSKGNASCEWVNELGCNRNKKKSKIGIKRRQNERKKERKKSVWEQRKLSFDVTNPPSILLYPLNYPPTTNVCFYHILSVSHLYCCFSVNLV